MPTALIVDDEPVAAGFLATLVGLRGYATRTAFDAAGAEAAVRAAPPDVLLLDLMLPDRSGLDLCRDLARDPAMAAVPVLVVSARLARRNRIESLRAGACDFVPKPFTPEMIGDALEVAASWRATLAADAARFATVPLAGDDPIFHRAAARLRGHLVAAAPDPAITFELLIAALEAARAEALAQAATADPAGPAADFRIEPPWISLTLRGAVAWDTSADLAALRPRFDAADEVGGHLVLARRLGPSP